MLGTAEYELNAGVLMFDAHYNLLEKGEIYLNLSIANTDAAFDSLMLGFADDVPLELFPDGLPGPGDDATSPLHYGDYDFSAIHTYSDLDYTEYRATLGFEYKVLPNLGLFTAMSYFDIDDTAVYLQDATGSVTMLSGGLTWYF